MKNAPAAEAAKQEANKTITIPNGTNMQTSKTLQLLLSKLPPAARRSFRLKKIMHNLVAVSELCDAGCKVQFNDEEVLITHNKEIISKGWRDKSTRLWRIPIVEKQQLTREIIPNEQYANAAVQLNTPDYALHLANSVYDCSTQEQLIKFYHATLFSQTKKTLLEAARRGYLRGWPGLTQAAIRKHLDVEDATIKGHLNQVRQGVRSQTETTDPVQHQAKTNYIFATLADVGGTIYMDQTGRFLRVSSRGMKYIMVCSVYNGNYIKAIPIKNCSEGEFKRAYEYIYNICTKKG
jgi:hypothetical protein